MYAGGYLQNINWYMKKNDYGILTGEIIALLNKGHFEKPWMWSASWLTAADNYAYTSAYCSRYCTVINSTEELQKLIMEHQIQKGDLLYFGSLRYGESHTTIISDVTDTDVYLASHFKWYKHKSFCDNYNDYIDE